MAGRIELTGIVMAADTGDVVETCADTPSSTVIEIDIGELNGAGRVVVSGVLSASTSETLRRALATVVDAGYRQVLVDLDRVRLTDTTGLGVLVAARRRLGGQNGELRLICSGPAFLRMLDLTGLADVFVVDASPDNATANC
jgi:anti-sigma B factor antagonist